MWIVYILSAVALALHSVGFTAALKPLRFEAAETVVFDDSPGLARRFEGIGAISGGGATSKLLVNYPKQQRDEILDYLFKPNFGASLQIFKVEIGGDMQSTDGTEASHMHNSWEENYTRGYEWWLMQEAKKRNPAIKIYALPWGFPGWVGPVDNNPYLNPEVTADYVVRWIQGARKHYNLTVDYVGVWNERHYNVTYIKTLRKMLNLRGFQSTKIVAPDTFGWKIAADMQTDKDLAAAVHALGAHYPGTESTEQARSINKSLWASEDYSTYNNEVGGGCWARILNQNYVNGYMTATISWNLIGSYYPHLPFFRDGLMTAVQPWSGFYDVSTPVWMTAHTTQFVPVGWRYLSHDAGVGKLSKGGSYVSLTNDASDQLTIIIETMTHDHSKCIRPRLPSYNVEPQTIVLTLKGSFAKITAMNVWYSKLVFDGGDHIMFQQKEPLVFRDGQASLSLGLDEIVTLTTVQTGHKGAHSSPPAPKPFPSVITDDFSKYEENQEPFFLSPQIGSYEVRDICGNKVARQTVLQRPVYWCKSETLDKTMSIVGDYTWTDMAVGVSFHVPEINGTDGVFVAARVDRGGCDSNEAQGVFFFVFPVTEKYIVANDLARKKVLTEGSVPSKTGWHNMTLTVSGGKAVGTFDKATAFTLDLPKSPANGWGAIGTDSFGLADFDNFLYRRGPTKF